MGPQHELEEEIIVIEKYTKTPDLYHYQYHYCRIGWFGWCWFARGNALCNISHEKSCEAAASLPGRFLSRHCFVLCITMEVEPRIVKQYTCHHCCRCKNYQGKGMEGGKKCLCVVFWPTRWLRVCEKKKHFGASYSTSNKFCLLPDTVWLRASKNAFKVGSVKFANSLSPPSIVKKVCTRSKSSQGT